MSAPQLEEGDDIFAELTAAMDAVADAGEDSTAAPAACSTGPASGTATKPGSGPRLSWAAKAAATGAGGTVLAGYQLRQSVLLPLGIIPCPPVPPPLLPVGQPAAGAGGKVAIFGTTAGQGNSTAAGATAAGAFSEVGQGSLVERYAGLKIKNPRMSHTQMRSRLADTSVLRLSQVRQRHRTAGLEGSWVTICVVGEKSKPRETAAGRSYSIWKVTDLDQTCLSLFLFSGAHSDLWREPEGTIVALAAPKVKTDGDFSLSVGSADQVWVLGQSPEFGHCKGKKKNGEPCRMPVNVSRCPFCPYHVQSEYNRMKPTGRNEFQTSNLKTAFRPGMQRSLHWTPGNFEAGAAKQERIRALTATQLQGVAATARDKGSAAGARYLDTVANPAAAAAAEAASHMRLTPAAAIAAAEAKGPTAAALAAAPIPAGRSGGSLVLLLPQPKSQVRQKQQAKRKAGGTTDASKRRSGGYAGHVGMTMVELEDDEEEAAAAAAFAEDRGAYDPVAAARQRAVELLQAAGGASAPDPNSSRRVPEVLAAAAALQQEAALQDEPAASAAARGMASQQAPLNGAASATAAAAVVAATGSRRAALAPAQAHLPPPLPSIVFGGPAATRPPVPVCRTQGGPTAGAAAAAAVGRGSRPWAGSGACGGSTKSSPTPRSAMEAAFGGLLREVEASGAAAKSTRYKELVEDEEFEKLDKIMAALEQKDEMAARMESVTRLAVQAFRCKICCYTAERRCPKCAAHPHAVERVEATKRWWQCGGCKFRFTTVGQRYPSGRCAKCNQPGTEFKGVSMFRPQREHDFQRQQSDVAGRDQLVARGTEQNWANSW